MQFQSVFYGAGLILRLGSFTTKAALNSDEMKASRSMVPPRNIIIMFFPIRLLPLLVPFSIKRDFQCYKRLDCNIFRFKI